LRRPELDETINESLTDIDFNINKALERLADNQINQGVSSQQYVVTGANELADFLSNSGSRTRTWPAVTRYYTKSRRTQ